VEEGEKTKMANQGETICPKCNKSIPFLNPNFCCFCGQRILREGKRDWTDTVMTEDEWVHAGWIRAEIKDTFDGVVCDEVCSPRRVLARQAEITGDIAYKAGMQLFLDKLRTNMVWGILRDDDDFENFLEKHDLK